MTTATTDNPAITIEEMGEVALVKLNRPEKLNAWGPQMSSELNAFLEGVNRGEYQTRCIVLTGEGRAFCSGADVGGLATRTEGGAQRPPWRPPHPEVDTTGRMRGSDVPIIGAINGYAIGLGFGLALATDLRIAADDARFQVTQVKRGLFADFGLGYFLPRAIGTQRGLDLMFTGRMIDAQEALSLGLVLEVVPRDSLIEAALAKAREIAKSGPLGIAASKRVAYLAEDDAFRNVQLFTGMAIDRLFMTEDAKEGVQSFSERREPEFKGR